jgi:hypothetical protein
LAPLVAAEDVADVVAAFPVGATVGEEMLPAMATAVPLRLGDRVRGNWKGGGAWFPATVQSIEAGGGVVVKYTDDEVEEMLAQGSYERLFERLSPKYACFNTRGWKIIAHNTDGDPVFRRPSPPCPPRGSAATSRIVQFIWKSHPHITRWSRQKHLTRAHTHTGATRTFTTNPAPPPPPPPEKPGGAGGGEN